MNHYSTFFYPNFILPNLFNNTSFYSDWCYLEALGKEGALKYLKQNKRNFVDRMVESGVDQIKLNMDDEDIDMDDFNTMPEPEDLLKMRSCSPIIYAKNVRAPVLMLIGGKDRRVPMSQGVAYYHTLRAKGNYFSKYVQLHKYFQYLQFMLFLSNNFI